MAKNSQVSKVKASLPPSLRKGREIYGERALEKNPVQFSAELEFVLTALSPLMGLQINGRA
jgi:hypothetical protein